MSTEQGTDPRVGCTADADGLITFDLPPGPVEDRRLLLRLRPKKGQPEKTLHVLDLELSETGRRRAVLDTRTALAEGRWDVYLLEDGGSRRQRMRPGPRDLRALVDGHLRERPSPLAVRIPYATADGYLAVRTWLRPAHAEAGGLDITDRSTTVGARLHGARLQEGAVVHLRVRGGGTVRTVAPRAADDGHGFSFVLDHKELAAGAGAAGGVWDVLVRPAEGAPLIRVGRLLDDVADRRDVFVYPTVRAGGAALRPYYTLDNDLSVEVTRPAG